MLDHSSPSYSSWSSQRSIKSSSTLCSLSSTTILLWTIIGCILAVTITMIQTSCNMVHLTTIRGNDSNHRKGLEVLKGEHEIDEPTLSDSARDERVHHKDVSSSSDRTIINPLLSSPMEALKSFQLVKVVGSGGQSIGFEGWYTPPSASLPVQGIVNDGEGRGHRDPQHVIVKIGRMKHIHYFDVEVNTINQLLAENDNSTQQQQQQQLPSGIPPILMAVRGIQNPFREEFKNDKKKLKETLDPDDKLQSYKLSNLLEDDVVSVIVSPLLDMTINKRPRDFTSIYEMRTYLKSMLKTLGYAHARNVMHCDLHEKNVHFDGRDVTFFDWNGAFIFEEGKRFFYYPDQMFSLFPPEARIKNSEDWNVNSTIKLEQVENYDDDDSPPELLYNINAVHVSVSAADIWAVGLITNRYLKRNDDNGKAMVRNTDSEGVDDGTEKQLWTRLCQLKDWMMTENPYDRPTAHQLLDHPFFSGP